MTRTRESRRGIKEKKKEEQQTSREKNVYDKKENGWRRLGNIRLTLIKKRKREQVSENGLDGEWMILFTLLKPGS